MKRRPPRSKRTDTLYPYTTRVRCQPPGSGHRHQRRDLGAAARLAEKGDIAGIAAEGRDVPPHPLEREDQIELPRIAAVRETRIEPREIEIAERVQPVVDRDHDDIAAQTGRAHV